MNEKTEVPILSTDAYFSLAGMGLFHDCRTVLERSKDFVEIVRLKN